MKSHRLAATLLVSAGLATGALVTAGAASAVDAPLQFAAAQKFDGGISPWLLTTGDAQGDGQLDISVANIFALGSGGATILTNSTTDPEAVQFAAPIAYPGSGTQSTLLADFSGDSRAEHVVCDPGLLNGQCSVYPNTTPAGASTPSFGSPVVVKTGSVPEVIRATDMNRDGHADLVIANASTPQSAAVAVALNTSTGGTLSFAPQQTFPGGAVVEGMDTADLNGDGRPDVISGNTASNNVTILVNQTAKGSSKLAMASPQTLPTTAGPTAVVAADINRDGRMDLAIGSSFTVDNKDLNIYLNATPKGSTTLTFTHQVFAADPGIEGITAGDFDGSGRPSIAYAAYRTQAGYQQCTGAGLLPTICQLLGTNGPVGAVGVMQNLTPKGSMSAKFAGPIKLVSGNVTVSVVQGDFNGDGKPDLAAGNWGQSGKGGVTIFTNQTGD